MIKYQNQSVLFSGLPHYTHTLTKHLLATHLHATGVSLTSGAFPCDLEAFYEGDV
jgi:hypothetical protein